MQEKVIFIFDKSFKTKMRYDFQYIFFYYGGWVAKENLWPKWEGANISDVFGVFFPSVIGIFAGASMSGDLRDPNAAIPKG
jgi:hypothetical protein